MALLREEVKIKKLGRGRNDGVREERLGRTENAGRELQ